MGDEMDEKLSFLFILVNTGGILAPLAFIMLHVVRQFLFIPVPLVIISGGVLFGTVMGTIYSFVGLMFVSLLFYFIVRRLPATHEKFIKIKQHWLGKYRHLTVPQISMLRLVPFIHYHLMNFCIMERNNNFKKYFKNTLITNIPLAFIYTVFGEFIRSFTPTTMVIFLFIVFILVYILREKITIIKWKEFFEEGV